MSRSGVLGVVHLELVQHTLATSLWATAVAPFRGGSEDQVQVREVLMFTQFIIPIPSDLRAGEKGIALAG